MNRLACASKIEPQIKNFRYIVCGIRDRDVTRRRIHDGREIRNHSKYYRVLGLREGADQESVRRAFIDLCKKYHPDSGNPLADVMKFQEVENAYRLLQNKFAEERWNVNEGIGEYGLYYDKNKKRKSKEEAKEFDIKHNAPQHRQYLSFNGIGSGTPSQRQKQYAAYQTLNAARNIYDHNVKKLQKESCSAEQTLVLRDKSEAKKIKTRYGIERLVEDLIQESMAKGEFENLRGAGKPLPECNYNPYVDFMTHKMNEIMIENGFVPEWITLRKEISDEGDSIRDAMKKQRKYYGPFPLTMREEGEWDSFVRKLAHEVKALNNKIDKYNLVVPVLDKQMLHFNVSRESDKVLKHGEHYDPNAPAETAVSRQQQQQHVPYPLDFFNFFSFLNRKR